MAQINPYFDLYTSQSEQDLVEDLIIEAIQMYGVETFYLPRTFRKEDKIFGEDVLSIFDSAYSIEMYFDSVNGFEGDRNFLSKFGLEIRKQASFVLAMKRFNEVLKPEGGTSIRPLEGDLIYLPLTRDIWEVRFADHESVFYQLGKNYIWRLTVEKFVYSSETLQTGIPDVDQVGANLSTVIDPNQPNKDPLANDGLADNTAIQQESDQVIDFSETNPFCEGQEP